MSPACPRCPRAVQAVYYERSQDYRDGRFYIRARYVHDGACCRAWWLDTGGDES